MIKFQDQSKENIQIAIDPANAAVMSVAAFTINDVRVPAQSFDLSRFQGETFRLYTEESGDLSTEKEQDHFWLLAEAKIPEKVLQNQLTGEVDEDGRDITQTIELPLDLNQVEITVFALPEVNE